MRIKRMAWAILPLVVGVAFLTGCQGASADRDLGVAERTYVPPGEMDEYYLFYSGGHGGDVRVAGLPSMRQIKTIPVFNPNAAYGYRSEERRVGRCGEYRLALPS